MARTTAERVKGVLLHNYDTRNNPSLAPFIRIANLLTTRVVTAAASRDITISDEESVEIETWLAAHYYACSHRPRSEQKIGGSSAKYDGKTETGLKATLFGQMAMTLDPSGSIESLASGGTPTIEWLGSED